MEEKFFVFEWDCVKCQSNIKKHGIDFSDATEIFKGFFYSYENTSIDYEEERYVAVGLLGNREIAVVYTPRGKKVRIISARRARIEERKLFYKEAEKSGDRFC